MTDGRVHEPATAAWGWTAHERAQRRRYASLPLAAKIAWLEEAQRMVLYLERQRSLGLHHPEGDQAEG